jgi:membrane protein
VAIYTASGAASGLITALNRAFQVTETRPLWRVKLRAIWATVAAAYFTIVATAALLIGPNLVHRIWAFFGLGGAFDRLWAALRWPVALLALTLMLAGVYYFLPNVKRKFRLITPGSVTAVILWLLTSLAFKVYGPTARWARRWC